jgi:hypothetical protein
MIELFNNLKVGPLAKFSSCQDVIVSRIFKCTMQPIFVKLLNFEMFADFQTDVRHLR